ncbi:MAG: Asp-tRNA(Asn)/Glu-tRNA(Gln) amidotransferase subunit GatC [Bacteroidetes bacterium]|nr:Asp-tRNA(Asn)/Glu-tRNA(Gln) amidotransferase subunit GatC [Bacteroidota bacterium]MCH8523558.1 Asp-tRNA(Asn)/Glu-tRNA(Gln) amidotransferase subunit GatC [Balneolales bacterium]
MSVTKDDVKYMANLARLRLSDDEVELFQKDMNKILDYMDQLNQVDTSHVEPLEHVLELPAKYRADIAVDPLPHEEALKNAPDADKGHFRVPRVID